MIIHKNSVTGSLIYCYVVTNAQGDVYEILNENGIVLARYTYDAWGNILSIKNRLGNDITDPLHISHKNSIRYRGYVYDRETGFYYLQSRYYDPETGRFLNCDDVNYIGANDTFTGWNGFAYCENEPVDYVDPEGKIALLTCVLIGAGIGLIIGASTGALISYNRFQSIKWRYVLVGGIFGIAIGALTGYGVGVAIGATASSTVGLSSLASNLARNVSKLKYSKTIEGYVKTRKYYKYTSIIKHIIQAATPVKDGKTALKWVVPGTINGTKGVWELVINPSTKVIYHFLFNSKK